MSALRRHQRLVSWVSLLALVLAMLVPGVVRAWPADRAGMAPWDVVCSSASNAVDSAHPADPVAHPLDHCPLCTLQTDQTFGLPGAPAPVLPAQLSFAPPIGVSGVSLDVGPWPAALARAPPVQR